VPCPTTNRKKRFRVIDRRPFTAEGELRKEVVEEAEREAKREAAKIPAAPPEAAKSSCSSTSGRNTEARPGV